MVLSSKIRLQSVPISSNMKECSRYARRYALNPEVFSNGRIHLRRKIADTNLLAIMTGQGVIKDNTLLSDSMRMLLCNSPEITARELGVAFRSTDIPEDIQFALSGRLIQVKSGFFTPLYSGPVFVLNAPNGLKTRLSAMESVTLGIIQLVKGNIGRWNQINELVRNAGIRVNLSGLYMPRMPLGNADFAGTDLVKAVLTGCKMGQASFDSTDVTGTDISGAEISKEWHPLFKMLGVDTRATTWV